MGYKILKKISNRNVILTILNVLFLDVSNAQNISLSDSLVVGYLSSQNFQKIDSLIQKTNVNQKYFSGSQTLLTLAITNSSLEMVKFLVEWGADVNVVLNTITPLIQCAIYDKDTIAEYLIKNGALVDKYNIQRNTPLLYSARLGSINTLKVFTRYRANPFFRNFQNYNSLEFAEAFDKREAAELLKDYMVQYSKGIYPSCFDGPHVEWISKRKARVFYLVNDSLQSKVYIKFRNLRATGGSLNFKGFHENDTLQYKDVNKIVSNRQINYTFNQKSKIFAVGDVHGEYDSLVKLLINSNVIDKEFNWKFNNGMLIFMGDLVDRGDKVTEVLWLMHQLSNQAAQEKGSVHILLGNHELLVLANDNRYIHEKYQLLTRGNRMSYSDLFDKNVFPGSFIREFKSAVIVDSTLFVHAGLSPALLSERIPIDKMNLILRFVLNPERVSLTIDADEALKYYKLLISDVGIFWYRGYVVESPSISKAPTEELERVLKAYGVKAMVIGHTEVESIKPEYNGKLYPINVPFAKKGTKAQGLLIEEDGTFWRCDIDGHKERLSHNFMP